MTRSSAKNAMRTNAAPTGRIIIVSDVSLGYGVPQIPALAQSLARHYGLQVLIIEPDQLERPRVLSDSAELAIQRVVTMSHPYSWAGRAEYCRQAQAIIERHRPELLIFSAYYPLPALLNLRHQPKSTILYQIEHIGDQQYELDLTRAVMDRINIVIFPEANRARADLSRIKLPQAVKSILMLNCTPTPPAYVDPSKRNGRVFYGGTFDKERTLGKYFLDDTVKALPIDIYGLIQGFGSQAEVTEPLNGSNGGTAYRGYIPSGPSFFDRLSHYNFSIIMWAPLDEATVNAAPNKLFDAISCGVPPFCAPHPICIDLISRYRCGILMDDWSLDGFRGRLQQASRMIGTDDYAEMVANCLKARDAELNWDHQFSLLVPHLVQI